MPYLLRDPKPQRDKTAPVIVHPLWLTAYALFIAGCFTHGTASIVLFLLAFTTITTDRVFRSPRIVFPAKQDAVERPHP